MKQRIEHKAVTLVELLAVVVILGIIASIGILVIGNLISNTRTKAYRETVASLNTATENYILWEQITTEDVFDGLETNSDRISILFSEGYISEVTQPNTPYSFVWDIPTQTWVLSSEEIIVIGSPEINYNFEEDSLTAVIEQGGVITTGTFRDNGTSISTSYGLLFIDNNKSNYTVTVNAELDDNTYGGYGIFFETLLDDNNKDTGFILQVDRGYSSGEIIIRPRTDGKEQNPIYRYPIGFDANGDFVVSGGTKNNSNPWWSEAHDIKLVVGDITDATYNKQISVYIDDVFVFSKKFTSAITPSNVNGNQTGLRVWALETIFYSFQVN
ncbi:type II secretion system protein [Mariniplasma anaerobium]|nr:type II secretion system protein [Mariniplasma anaerobium]